MWGVLIGAAVAQEAPAAEPSPWNSQVSFGVPRLSLDERAFNVDAALQYEKGWLGWSAQYARDNRTVQRLGTQGPSGEEYSRLVDAQLHAYPARTLGAWSVSLRAALTDERIATEYDYAADDFGIEASSVTALNLIAGARSPEGAWQGSVWGRLIAQAEEYGRVDAQAGEFQLDVQSSVGWAAYGVAQRTRARAALVGRLEARRFQIQRASVARDRVDVLQRQEAELQVAAAWLPWSVLGLTPGAYLGAEVTHQSDDTTSITPSLGLQLMRDAVAAPAF